MNLDDLVDHLKSYLSSNPGLVKGPFYAISHKQLGEIYYCRKDFVLSAYHFSESHAVGLRQAGVLESLRSESGLDDSNDPLSFHSHYAKLGSAGMLKRLEEMPSEWTLIQLTRRFDPSEAISIRKSNKTPCLKDFFLTRFSCGNDMSEAVPVVVRLSWPDDATSDLIQSFYDIKEKLGIKEGSSSHIRKQRQAASLDVERHCREIGPMVFKEWTCLMLGKLYSKALEEEIREIINKRLDEAEVSVRERYLCHLLAEGCCHLEHADLEVALYQVFEGNESLALRALETLVRIKETHGPRLHVAKRHPLLLILDDHLDIIPWESLPFLKRHPVSRVYSLHISHSLYHAHRHNIKDGLREINDNDVCYFVVNPDGNLPDLEVRIPKFLKKRFPSWVGIIGQKPTEEQIVEALTETKYQTYVYCGHGSGSQYLRAEKIQKLRVNPVQLLYGCSSVGLRDVGGLNEMYGDVMEYALAKSGCTLGMLWPVTSEDTDRITMTLANIYLPGHPVDIHSLVLIENDKVKKEPELLRALRDVRECVSHFFNGAALVARGIPVKLQSKGLLDSFLRLALKEYLKKKKQT